MADYLERMLAHMSWADESVLQSLEANPAPEPRWLELFAHVLAAEHVWLSRIAGEKPEVAVWPDLWVKECRLLAEANRTRFAGLAALPVSDRARPIRYTNSAGQEFTSTVEDILLHVCLHGSYHRGQIALAMRQGGGAPAPTDYIGFIRGVPAATRR